GSQVPHSPTSPPSRCSLHEGHVKSHPYLAAWPHLLHVCIATCPSASSVGGPSPPSFPAPGGVRSPTPLFRPAARGSPDAAGRAHQGDALAAAPLDLVCFLHA